jgi:hypothetical protein
MKGACYECGATVTEAMVREFDEALRAFHDRRASGHGREEEERSR